MKKNIALKFVIFKSGLSQRELSKRTQISETLISLAVNGKINLLKEQLEKISEVLKIDVSELGNE